MIGLWLGDRKGETLAYSKTYLFFYFIFVLGTGLSGLFHFTIGVEYRKVVGLLDWGRITDPTQGLLNRAPQMQINTHTYIGIRTCDSSVREC
jgi:hypothetical protein